VVLRRLPQLPNFRLFAQLTESWTNRAVRLFHRRSNAAPVLLDRELLRECETLIIISFDTRHSAQEVTPAEVITVQDFLAQPDHAVFVCPHHAIGDVEDRPEPQRLAPITGTEQFQGSSVSGVSRYR
jgi:hypothetical protein